MVNTMKSISPTPHPDVNEILSLLLANVKAILSDQLIGMYLHGSLANGGFDTYSDIDVIFTTEDAIKDVTFSLLQSMHSEMAKLASPWATQLEVAYIPEKALRCPDPATIRYPHLDRGSGEILHWMAAESDWSILRHILRERGIIITGPDPKTLIEPVSPHDLRMAVAQGVPIWFTPILENPSEIKKRGYQSFFVLTICRMLYTLKHGEVLPKPAAAQWGMEHLDTTWKQLIERALIGRRNPMLEADPEDIHGTLHMMRYILRQIKPTPYPDVNTVLNLLLRNVKEILGDKFVGMYLYGSLSSGDFDPETSDIDFLVVTTEHISVEKVAALEAMHKQSWATSSKRALELEGSYVPKDLIRRHDPQGVPCPTVNEGKFYMDRRGSDWIIQRHVVREQGVVVEGPDPKTLIDFVSPGEIRAAVRGILHEWWFPMLKDPSWLHEHRSAYCAFAVITMCRALHALEYGTVVSKPRATQWAKQTLAKPWLTLINQAVTASRHGSQEDFLDETLEFIRFVKHQTAEQTNS